MIFYRGHRRLAITSHFRPIVFLLSGQQGPRVYQTRCTTKINITATYIHTYEYISYLHRCPVLWPVPGFQIFNQAFQTLVCGIAYVALSFFAKVCHQHTLFKRLQYLFTGNVT